MASSSSVELLSYQDALEGVLTWLLEAEEVMEKQPSIANDVHVVKDQFNQHEVGIYCWWLTFQGDFVVVLLLLSTPAALQNVSEGWISLDNCMCCHTKKLQIKHYYLE